MTRRWPDYSRPAPRPPWITGPLFVAILAGGAVLALVSEPIVDLYVGVGRIAAFALFGAAALVMLAYAVIGGWRRRF